MTKDQIFEFFRHRAKGTHAPKIELECGHAYQLAAGAWLLSQTAGRYTKNGVLGL